MDILAVQQRLLDAGYILEEKVYWETDSRKQQHLITCIEA